jgi:DNA-binding transcriptional regulator GbsR (MarR family)
LNIVTSTPSAATLASASPFAVVADGMSTFEAEIVAVFVDLVVLLGLPKSVGEIYGLLFASAQPLTFADIEQKLGLSKGSVSQGLRALREVGAIREAVLEGSANTAEEAKESARVARWEAVVELRRIIGALLQDRLTPNLQSQDTHVERAAACLDELTLGANPTELEILKKRLEKLQTWQARARTFLPLIAKMI